MAQFMDVHSDPAARPGGGLDEASERGLAIEAAGQAVGRIADARGILCRHVPRPEGPGWPEAAQPGWL